ncbi:diguanylate cyclase domain-containing protein [Leptothrix discophora]|uniref:Diguanylate cyclase n=1 Tax=Leptothrix discophora TaxID=89 RepID=A0ABT9G8I8_LEPDI|nr:diguanylate cyclase [Leptothrix discophora]MDP4302802.1 diguanylate cyclase [Leptothrix discophora]
MPFSPDLNPPDPNPPSLFDLACADALTVHARGPRVFALLHIGAIGPALPSAGRGSPADVAEAAAAAVAPEASAAALIERRIALVIRAGDVVCRQGPQDVVCLVTQLRDSAEAHAIARLLMRSMALCPSVQPSIGIALFPRDGDATSSLRDHAAAALEHARRSQLGIAAVVGPTRDPAASTTQARREDGPGAWSSPAPTARTHGLA